MRETIKSALAFLSRHRLVVAFLAGLAAVVGGYQVDGVRAVMLGSATDPIRQELNYPARLDLATWFVEIVLVPMLIALAVSVRGWVRSHRRADRLQALNEDISDKVMPPNGSLLPRDPPELIENRRKRTVTELSVEMAEAVASRLRQPSPPSKELLHLLHVGPHLAGELDRIAWLLRSTLRPVAEQAGVPLVEPVAPEQSTVVTAPTAPVDEVLHAAGDKALGHNPLEGEPQPESLQSPPGDGQKD